MTKTPGQARTEKAREAARLAAQRRRAARFADALRAMGWVCEPPCSAQPPVTSK